MRQNVAKTIDAPFADVAKAIVGQAPAILKRPEIRTAKSPLRYPGGKSRAAAQIVELMPDGLDEICSPFLGGGSVELTCAASGMEVHGYDAFEPLVNFWQVALEDASLLAGKVAEHHPLTRTEFYALQKRYFSITERIERAAAFYALNRASFSGTTLSGGMSPDHPRFTPSSIDRLRDFAAPNLNVQLADFTDSIKAHPDAFMYLDPPYANGERLYGERGDMHEDFDHETLSGLLRERDGWILSYNDCELVRDLYDGHPFVEVNWAYGIANKGTSNEVIVLSRDYVRVL